MERVSLLKVSAYDDRLPQSITTLLEPLGGLESVCHSGQRVLLKPNFLMAKTVESAALTHPALILAVASRLKEIGCQVAIGDSPGIGTAEGVIRKLGIEQQLKRLGVKTVEFTTRISQERFERSLPFERRFKNLELAGELLEYDHIINLAKFKSHGQMGITLTTKNLFGCVVGHNKGRWHFAAGRDLGAFARLLVEIALTVNASLHILDGIIGMDRNGPSHGRPRALGVLLAGTNPLAVDRVAVELIGKQPEQFPIFQAAREIGHPGINMEELEIVGANLSECQVRDFEIPTLAPTGIFVNQTVSRMLAWLVKQRLILDPQLCIQCRKCERLCPAGAIHFTDRITMDENQCIHCCCCQELCPVGALSVREPWGAKVLRFLKMM